MAGSCATGACESSQGRKAAALSRLHRVPQQAWPPLRVHGQHPTDTMPPMDADARRQRRASTASPRCTGGSARARSPSCAARTTSCARCAPRSRPTASRTPTCSAGRAGTGKTSVGAGSSPRPSTASSPKDGEPCGVCHSCVEITRGTSLDVTELDAASNNGVDAIRDLVNHAALGTPGRWKVYIVDEVHMLSTAAANALLKTVEEPPPHVVFVLATTDPQKVPATHAQPHPAPRVPAAVAARRSTGCSPTSATPPRSRSTTTPSTPRSVAGTARRATR